MPQTATWPYLIARSAVWMAAGLRGLTAPTSPRVLTGTLERLGPAFVKGGQLLSTRADLLPPLWCAELGRLTDRMGAMPAVSLRRVLDEEYGGRCGWPFRRLDSVPVASGSVACVYRGRLHDGRDVAVKVRRPGIARMIDADFRLAAAAAGVLQAVPGLRGTPMRRMVEQVAPAVRAQLDLAREAGMMARLRANLDGLVHVPAPVPDACAGGVLVMDYVDGLGRFDADAFDRGRRRAIMTKVLRAMYRMLFADGLVHCDLHPGNLYLRRTGEAVIVDAGFVVELSPQVRRQFAQFFLFMAQGRGDDCADVVLASAAPIPAGLDLTGFRRDLRELIAAGHGRRAGEFRLATFAGRLFAIQRRHGITAAPEFVFPLLSLLVLEGMILDFDVDIDFQALAVPTLLRALYAGGGR